MCRIIGLPESSAQQQPSSRYRGQSITPNSQTGRCWSIHLRSFITSLRGWRARTVDARMAADGTGPDPGSTPATHRTQKGRRLGTR